MPPDHEGVQGDMGRALTVSATQMWVGMILKDYHMKNSLFPSYSPGKTFEENEEDLKYERQS